MGNLKLVDAGVFLYKRWKPIVFIAISVMIVTVLVACLLGNPYSAQQTATFSNNPYLVGMISGVNAEKMFVNTVDVPYPQDGWAVEYVESIKPSKASTGRVNPFHSSEFFAESKLANYFGTEDFKTYMEENGVDTTKISVLVTSNTITVTSLEKDKDLCQENLQQVISLCSSYIDALYKNTIEEIADSYEALLTADKAQMEDLLAQYETIKDRADTAKTRAAAMQNEEECRRLLNEYAQLAYDYDVTVAVLSIADDLTAASLGPTMVVNSLEYSSTHSPVMIVVYAVLGLMVGLVLGGFAAFIGEFCKTVKKKASKIKNAQ